MQKKKAAAAMLKPVVPIKNKFKFGSTVAGGTILFSFCNPFHLSLSFNYEFKKI